MIAIIAKKPSVGQDIARVVGATEKMDGYITGNGYMVTWALGHLVSLALPGTYGYTRTTAEDLPMIPEPFRLVPRQIRTDRGMVTDIAAGKQLKIIDEVFSVAAPRMEAETNRTITLHLTSTGAATPGHRKSSPLPAARTS